MIHLKDSNSSLPMKNISLIALMIAFAALSRFVPHAYNFTPIGAMALFGAAYIQQSRYAYLLPLATLWVTDIVLNNVFYPQYFQGFSWYGDISVYVAFLLNVFMGRKLLYNRVKITPLIATSLASSILFFFVTNTWSAFTLPLYSKDASGVMAALTAGLPFFKATVVGDLIFCLILFGAYQFLSTKVFKLNVERA